jgi:hypothetical protein
MIRPTAPESFAMSPLRPPHTMVAEGNTPLAEFLIKPLNIL